MIRVLAVDDHPMVRAGLRAMLDAAPEDDRFWSFVQEADVPVAVHGTRLEIRGKNVKGPATAHTLPFDDAEKKKRTAVG